MSPVTEIYVALLDEGVAVWKPVRAEQVHGKVYRILDQPYDRDNETWQFEPGERVECEWITLDEGQALAARNSANQT